MADLGQIAEVDDPYTLAYSAGDEYMGPYTLSGTLSINSVFQRSTIEVYSHKSGYIQDIQSRSDGSFDVVDLPLADITLVGYDKNGVRQSESRTSRPNSISFSRTTELGWDATNTSSNCSISGLQVTSLTTNDLTNIAITENKHTLGRYFAEIEVTNLIPDQVGVDPSSVGFAPTTTTELGNDSASIRWDSDGNVYNNSSLVAQISAWEEGDILTLFLSDDGVWFMRERAGVKTIHGNILNGTNPVFSTYHQPNLGVCVNPMVEDEVFTIRTLDKGVTNLHQYFLPWDTIEG